MCIRDRYTPIAGNKLEIIFYENETCRTYSTNLHRWKTPINQSPICKASYKIFSYEKMSYDLQNYDDRITTYVLGNCKKSWTSKLPKYSRDILTCSDKLDWLGIVSNN